MIDPTPLFRGVLMDLWAQKLLRVLAYTLGSSDLLCGCCLGPVLTFTEPMSTKQPPWLPKKILLEKMSKLKELFLRPHYLPTYWWWALLSLASPPGPKDRGTDFGTPSTTSFRLGYRDCHCSTGPLLWRLSQAIQEGFLSWLWPQALVWPSLYGSLLQRERNRRKEGRKEKRGGSGDERKRRKERKKRIKKRRGKREVEERRWNRRKKRKRRWKKWKTPT